jgi:hypothetical protein
MLVRKYHVLEMTGVLCDYVCLLFHLIMINDLSCSICMLFHISSKFDFFIGVEMVMCHALICDKEIQQSLTFAGIIMLMTARGFRVATSLFLNATEIVQLSM